MYAVVNGVHKSQGYYYHIARSLFMAWMEMKSGEKTLSTAESRRSQPLRAATAPFGVAAVVAVIVAGCHQLPPTTKVDVIFGLLLN